MNIYKLNIQFKNAVRENCSINHYESLEGDTYILRNNKDYERMFTSYDRYYNNYYGILENSTKKLLNSIIPDFSELKDTYIEVVHRNEGLDDNCNYPKGCINNYTTVEREIDFSFSRIVFKLYYINFDIYLHLSQHDENKLKIQCYDNYESLMEYYDTNNRD